MLEVVAIKYNGIAPVLPVTGQLPAGGGSIGRGNDNAVVLPDPLRLLSRRHLLIEPDGQGAYVLTNISAANAAMLNDARLAPGEHKALAHGDVICIGGYLLEARIDAQREEAAAPQVTAAPTLPDLPNGQTAAADINAILDQSSTPALMSDDPLGIAAIEPVIAPGDFVKNSGQLLADLGQAKPAEPLVADLTHDPLLADGNPLLAEGSLDPLAMFGGEEKSLKNWLGTSEPASPALTVTTPAAPVNELHMPFSLESRYPHAPEVIPSAVASHTEAEPVAETQNTRLIPEEFSLDDLLGGDNAPPATLAVQQTDTTLPAEASQTAPPAPEPAVEPPTARAPTSTAQERAPTTAASGESPGAKLSTLHAALLEGLGLDELPAHRTLDAEFMRTLGALLRTAIDGTIKLMAARATVKREVRANVTVISPERNNPLKFSPDADVALLYLLGRDYPGFMAAQDAVAQAFADLLTHQVGVMSGMRSALSLVLERFDPQTIAHDVNTYGMIDKLLTMGHKARLWDAYERYFEHTREQAADRFQEFFGTAFVQAYEAQTKTDKTQKHEVS